MRKYDEINCFLTVDSVKWVGFWCRKSVLGLFFMLGTMEILLLSVVFIAFLLFYYLLLSARPGTIVLSA